jgi:hypothetical protein
MQQWTPSILRPMQVWKKAEPFWHDNIRSKALDSWTPADLLAAVELANNQLYITVLRKDLRKEERNAERDATKG